jgi:hypothetical protein
MPSGGPIGGLSPTVAELMPFTPGKLPYLQGFASVDKAVRLDLHYVENCRSG